MSKEELLKPRYKVIADYPVSRFVIGEVVELEDGYYTDILDDRWSLAVFNKYPHIFKPLQWWEDRKPEDMPEYVISHKHYVQKVIKWEGRNYKDVPLFEFRNSLQHPITIGMANEWLPATETEYQQYLTSKH